MLHTINKSPFERKTLTSCLRFVDETSAILFLEDGVIATIIKSDNQQLNDMIAKKRVFVLMPDLKARGFNKQAILKGIQTVDYGGFVDLLVRYGTSVAWV